MNPWLFIKADWKERRGLGRLAVLVSWPLAFVVVVLVVIQRLLGRGGE